MSMKVWNGTEYVGVGGGAEIEKFNIAWRDSGGTSSAPKETTVATFDAGDGAIVQLQGAAVLGSTSGSARPQLTVGGTVLSPTVAELDAGVFVRVSGVVSVIAGSRSSSTSSFHLAGNVLPFPIPPRETFSASSSTTIELPLDSLVTIASHTATTTGMAQLSLILDASSYQTFTVIITKNGVPYHQVIETNASSNATSVFGLTGASLHVDAGDVFEFKIQAYGSLPTSRRLLSWSWTFS